MHIFYTPEIESNPFLPEEESAHCVRVLRMQEGDEIRLTDGRGRFYRARIAEAHPKHCAVEILETVFEQPSSAPFYVAVAPTKNLDRMEWLVEKLTEIGVAGIYFLNCRFSERKVLKTDRLVKIAVSAMKQSERPTLPEIGELTDFKIFLSQLPQADRYICHCYQEAEAGPRALLRDVCRPSQAGLVMIGPEGDFSLEEVKLALENGFQAVSLGDMRLRTETAALVAGLTLQMSNM